MKMVCYKDKKDTQVNWFVAILRTSFSDNVFLTSTVKSVHITYPAHVLATLSQNTALISTRRWCSLLTFFCYQEHRKSIVNFIVDMSVFNKSDTSGRLNIKRTFYLRL